MLPGLYHSGYRSSMRIVVVRLDLLSVKELQVI